MPLISVIVPIFNADKYLHKCLNSLLFQTVDDFEVILIDDGSTDHSGLICDDYARQDKRFVVVHKKNEGLSAARNDGIALAKGKWITFLDSDDWVENNFFKILDKHSDVDYIIASYSLHRRNGDRIDERFSQYKCDSIGDKLFLLKRFRMTKDDHTMIRAAIATKHKYGSVTLTDEEKKRCELISGQKFENTWLGKASDNSEAHYLDRDENGKYIILEQMKEAKKNA